MKKAIGILGGMGPGASAYMYKLLIDMAISEYGVKNNDEFPEIILCSVPVPDFISNQTNMVRAFNILKRRVKSLNSENLLSLSLACNTAHILLKDLEQASNHKFVSMVEEVAKEVKKTGYKKVGILATPSTIHLKLYQKELQKAGIDSISPNENQLKKIGRIIRNVLAGELKEKDRDILVAISDSLVEKGSEGIILGCTELPLIFSTSYKVRLFNSVEILSLALLRDYYKSNTIRAYGK